MVALLEQAPQMGDVGRFFLRCFGAFDFSAIELRLPEETFSGELPLRVGDLELALIEVGPAHTRGDTLVFVPQRRVLFSGDILFSGAHPIVWAGPTSNWIAACERIIEMDPEVIVPGHGPLADLDAVRELKAYFEYLYEQCRRLHSDGMSAMQAARTLALERWAWWGERERLVVNIASIYRELEADPEPANPLLAFQQMAELAG
jgi:glyoxylase-like metal-dependent hydrolase (beta-lactamase superfamily II)